MTIPVQDAVTSSVANGLTTVFPFGFKILSESDLLVLLDDVEAVSGFTVSGVGSETGGNVTFTVPPANGVKVTRALQPELMRAVDYQQFGDWLSPEVNNDFDRIWLALQMLNHNDKRSLRISIDNVIDQTILETPAERAGKIIGFDASGNVILYAGNDIDTGLVSALIANFLAATTQAGARTVIGAGDMNVADAQAQTGVSFTTTGSAGMLTVTTSPAYGTLATGQRMRLKFNAASTGTDTLNRDTTGAKSLKQYDSAGTKIAAVFAANQLADVVYDGTDYVLLDSLPASLSIASTAEAQALTDNTKGITPLRLKEAFQGSNQSLAAGGYQKLPGGLIIQWGNCTSNTTAVAVTFPVSFPTACVAVVLVLKDNTTTAYECSANSVTASGFGARNGSGLLNNYYIAIGY